MPAGWHDVSQRFTHVLFLYPDRLKESLRKQKTAIRTDSGVGTVFMVAGAGFELAAGSNKIKRLCFRPSINAPGPSRKPRPSLASPPLCQFLSYPATCLSNPRFKLQAPRSEHRDHRAVFRGSSSVIWSTVMLLGLGTWIFALGPGFTAVIQTVIQNRALADRR